MINHALTLETYNISEPFRVRDIIIVTCEDCLQNRPISFGAYKKLIENDNLTLCKSCRAIKNRVIYSESYKQSDCARSKSLSSTMKNKWNDDKYRSKQLKSIRSDISRQKHSVAAKALWKDEQYRDKVKTAKKRIESTVEFKKRMRKIYDSEEYRAKLRLRWKDEEYRNKVLKIWNDECFKLQFSERAKERSLKLWKNPEYKKKMDKAVSNYSVLFKQLFKNPLLREKISKAVSKVWDDPVYRQKQVDKSTRQWDDPEYRNKIMTILRSDVVKLKMSEASKKKWRDPEYRKKMAVAMANMPKISKLQLALYDILDNLDIEFYREGVDTSIGFYNFDCLVPKQGKMKKNILIECHDEYFHNLEGRKRLDRSKLTYINKYFSDYEVRVVWEQDFLFRDKVCNMLREWLCITENIQQVDFKFSDVIIKDISFKDSVNFLSRYHYLYTCPRGSLRYGAYVDNMLVAVCLLSPPIRNNIAQSVRSDLSNRDMLELSRFCIHPNYQKKNFASWFISRCIKKVSVKAIVSYCDTSMNHDGTIYKACGFMNDKVIKPDYWYVDNDGYVMHKRTLYGRAIKMSLRENEYALKHNFRKIFGSNKLRYVRFVGE